MGHNVYCSSRNVCPILCRYNVPKCFEILNFEFRIFNLNEKIAWFHVTYKNLAVRAAKIWICRCNSVATLSVLVYNLSACIRLLGVVFAQ